MTEATPSQSETRQPEPDATQRQEEPTEKCARFGHHPDPAIDFVVEVENIEGEIASLAAGLTPSMDLDARIFRAMTFRAGVDKRCLDAKAALRKIEASRAPPHPSVLAMAEEAKRQVNSAVNLCETEGSDDPEVRRHWSTACYLIDRLATHTQEGDKQS